MHPFPGGASHHVVAVYRHKYAFLTGQIRFLSVLRKRVAAGLPLGLNGAAVRRVYRVARLLTVVAPFGKSQRERANRK